MAYPQWLTPAGNLGVVPELEYYQFLLDAYDANLFGFKGNITANSTVITHVTNLDYLIKGQGIAGTGIPNNSVILDFNSWSNLNVSGNSITVSANATSTVDGLNITAIPIRYSRISGTLPPGIQVIDTGKLVGVPVSTPTVGADKNQTYSFSIRATNIYTGNITDRTFTLTITNVAPPIITPKTVVNNVQLQLVGNISANIGDYLVQSSSSANAQILTGVANSSNVTVRYVTNSPSFTLGYGNLRVNSANILLYPNVSYAAYPSVSTTVSSNNTRDLGLYFDGTIIDLQLDAIEFNPSTVLFWSVKSGTVPPGLTLTTDGLLSGYIYPIPAIGPSSMPGWDATPWDQGGGAAFITLGWDFPLGTTSKNFSWTVEVTDGVNYDTCTYTMLVYPRSYFTADSTLITVDATIANSVKLSVDTGSRHYPIILSTQSDIANIRQGDYFDFPVQALDLDEDILQYAVPSLSSGAFDEQTFVTPSDSIAYIADSLISGNLFTGVFPKTTIVNVSTLELPLGFNITANVGQYITQVGTTANARVTANVVNGSSVLITYLTSSNFTTGSGNILLNGNAVIRSTFNGATWSNVGTVPAAVISTPAVQADNTTPGLFTGDQIQFLQLDPTVPSYYWQTGTVNSKTTIRLTGNVIISGSVGTYLTQSGTAANATIVNVSATTGTITFGGNSLVGSISISGNILTANVGDFITQPSTGANATITSDIVYAINIPLTYTSGTFTLGSGWLSLNGANIAAFPISATSSPEAISLRANIGDIITQTVSGANATVLADQPGGTSASVQFNSNVFTLGSGNIKLNGGDINIYPTSTVSQVDIAAIYNSTIPFKFNTAGNYALIANVNTYAIPTKVISVGVTAGAVSTQGTIGYDEGRFDQGTLELPTGLTMDPDSGWLTGTIPNQTANETVYTFSILVFKRDYPGYTVTKQFSLTVLGDINNRIDWITPSNLGTIENGAVSGLYVQASSSKGKNLYYEYSDDSDIRLPQGLDLLSNGLISGRVSFEVFSLDQGQITIDGNATTFDNTYSFSITARDFDNTASATRTFTVRVLQRNIIPYENLYLKALTSRAQRVEFQSITQDRSVFPLNLIYRNEDPFYGIATDIKTLFIPGLTPSELSEYAAAVATNHFTKHITFGAVKTAVATDGSYDVVEIATGTRIGTFQDSIGFVPTDLTMGYTAASTIPSNSRLDTEHIKYEVVYVEVSDDNTNSQGLGPADTINLTGTINPYYDSNNNAYTIAYPNSFENMGNVMVNNIRYVNKGALPDWMTTKQPDGRVLGFTRAVVLAYTVENASATIAYRFAKAGYNLNELDFTVDRYQLDNNYSANFDIPQGKFIRSKETTFDRYPGLSSVFNNVGTVDYAVNISYEEINGQSIDSIVINGGLDGINTFQDGERLVFFNQEFGQGLAIGDTYNLGWGNVQATWGGQPWDWDKNTSSTTDDLAWDAANYIPGYDEHLLNSAVIDQRIGIWQINIDSDDIVKLTFVQAINYYDTLFVRNGFTHSATNIYYDPLVKTNNTLPNYSIIPQQINVIATTFDGNGTKFLNYRDSYSVPEQGDKYIKFAKTGVFT